MKLDLYLEVVILHKLRLKINKWKNIQDDKFWRESNVSYQTPLSVGFRRG